MAASFSDNAVRACSGRGDVLSSALDEDDELPICACCIGDVVIKLGLCRLEDEFDCACCIAGIEFKQLDDVEGKEELQSCTTCGGLDQLGVELLDELEEELLFESTLLCDIDSKSLRPQRGSSALDMLCCVSSFVSKARALLE